MITRLFWIFSQLQCSQVSPKRSIESCMMIYILSTLSVEHIIKNFHLGVQSVSKVIKSIFPSPSMAIIDF